MKLKPIAENQVPRNFGICPRLFLDRPKFNPEATFRYAILRTM